MSKVEKVQVSGDIYKKLETALLSVTINRDSLARSCSQSTMLHVEFLVSHLVGCLYANLQLSIEKDQESMDQLQDMIQMGLDDLKDMQKIFFKTPKEETT